MILKKAFLSLFIGIFLLILVMPAYGGVRPRGKLTVTTIPQEDQFREKGIMILGGDIQGDCDTNRNKCVQGLVHKQGCVDDDDDACNFEAEEQDRDLHAEYKMHVELDGVNVDPDTVTCWVVEKEICHIDGFCTDGVCTEGQVGFSPCLSGSGTGLASECNLPQPEGTEVIDVTQQFVCKFRKTLNKPGVGVLDVYYVGDPDELFFIGDHILKVQVTSGRNIGSEIQDICILDFPNCRINNENGSVEECNPESSDSSRFVFEIEWPDGKFMNRYLDTIGRGFASCKTAAFWQRHNPAGIKVLDCNFLGGSVPGTQNF